MQLMTFCKDHSCVRQFARYFVSFLSFSFQFLFLSTIQSTSYECPLVYIQGEKSNLIHCPQPLKSLTSYGRIRNNHTISFTVLILIKITADSHCSHEVKRHLLLGRKAMVNLDRILKSRHHLTDKGLYSQSYVFFQWSCTDI